MTSKWLTSCGLAALAATAWCVPARATVLTFNDEYYLKAGAAYSSVFAGATGNASSNGVYQETATGSPPTITRLSTSGVPGEYIQNTSNELLLFGWSQSLNYGQQVANVYNLTNPTNGSVLYLQYKVGGSTTPFNFNSIDLHSNGNLQFTLEGLDASSKVLDSAVVNVTGNVTNTYATDTFNWAGVTTVEIVSTAGLPVNWGSGVLYIDNVRINDPIATMEPASLLLLVTGLLGIVAVRRNA
jgi:hypothetical protein